jgi:hypothetical protein
MKGEDSMLSVIEKYVEEIKENKKGLNEEGVEYASVSIYNVALNGSNESSFGERNEMRSVFEENNKFSRMVDLCKYLISQQSSSPEQKRITDYISLAICLLVKSEGPSPFLGSILTYVDNLKTSPPHPNGFDVSRKAEEAWKGMMEWKERGRRCLAGGREGRDGVIEGCWRWEDVKGKYVILQNIKEKK